MARSLSGRINQFEHNMEMLPILSERATDLSISPEERKIWQDRARSAQVSLAPGLQGLYGG